MTQSSSRWPRIIMETGPSYAAVRAGDAIPFPPDWWLFVSTPIRSDGLVLSLFTIDGGHTNGPGWRYSSTNARFEKLSYDGGRQHWVPLEVETLKFGDQQKYGAEWVFRFIDDGPAVTVARRFGPHLCVNPRSLGYQGYSDPKAVHTSTWTLVRPDGSLGDLVVTEQRNDERTLSWKETPRFVGPSLFFVPQQLRQLDRELAKGIVAQMQDGQPASWLDFNGHVHAHPPNGSKIGATSSLYWQLTRGPYPKTDEERAAARAEMEATRTATPEEIAVVVRALYPVEWAREQQLLEECGALRMEDVEDGMAR